jgi:hypothetical protein
LHIIPLSFHPGRTKTLSDYLRLRHTVGTFNLQLDYRFEGQLEGPVPRMVHATARRRSHRPRHFTRDRLVDPSERT